MTAPAHWPPNIKIRRLRRRCAADGGHSMEMHPTRGGRQIIACTTCGHRGYDITQSKPRK